MSRQFKIEKAVRKQEPLLIGLFGASKSGKTFSALRLAVGIQKVFPGPIVFIDTESGRGLHYANEFNYEYVEFPAPFGSLDYLEVLKYAKSKNPSVTIIDSVSHEHEGPGGMIDFQEQELTRMAGDDYRKRERMNMLAWKAPKKARRDFINGLLRLKGNYIFCFRAKEGSRPVKGEGGKMKVENFGFMPICGHELVFEMTINCFLPPKSEGKPDWSSEYRGELLMMGLPIEFKHLFQNPGIQLDENIGEQMAKWALGDTKPAKKSAPHAPPAELATLEKYLADGLIPDKEVTIGKEKMNLLVKSKGAIELMKKLTVEFNDSVPGYKTIHHIIKAIEEAQVEPEELDVSREEDNPVSEQDELDIF